MHAVAAAGTVRARALGRWLLARVPASLKLTVPLILLAFAGVLSAVNLLYHVPQAEHAAEEDSRKRLAQEMSRLQSTLEYLLLKGDLEAAQHEISVLAHNHDVLLAALADDRNVVIAATHRASLDRPIAEASPEFDLGEAARAIRERRAGIAIDSNGTELLGHAGVLMGREHDELRPSRVGSLFLAYDLKRYKAEARAQVVQQSLYWAGWVTALALALWLVFHFLLTRRTARLVRAAEKLAAGDLGARASLRGEDELGRLSRAFDRMAREVALTQTRLQGDIAARKAAEAALRASEEQYHAMFSASIDGLALWNAAGAIVDVNPALWRMYGHAAPPARAAALDAVAGRAFAGLRDVARGGSRHAEVSEVRADGTPLALEVHAVAMQYQGKPHVLTIARDITEKKRSAAELARQRESFHQREKLAALGSLLAGVAHELNNPLSVVVARAVLLEEQGDPATQSAAAKIRTAAERCARIVRTFLAMARKQRPSRGPVAINEVVTAAFEIAVYAIRRGGIEASLDLAPDLPLVQADADQLHQVLLNLIINAQHALADRPGPRRVAIGSRFDADADAVRISVTDNGPGIPEHLRARIFEPYFTTKPIGMGTGVGLAVSLGIVEAHGGRLTVESPPGGGATFVIALPAGPHAAAQAHDAPHAQAATARRSVLVVDDEPDIRDSLVAILGSAGHRVTAASSGREALARLDGERFDVVLTDIRMPDVDGRALYREIEHRFPAQAPRVVFVTGDTLASELRDFVCESGRRVIEKPFMPGEVRRVVAEVSAAGDAVASATDETRSSAR